MKDIQNERAWTNEYWQHRTKTMAKDIILRKKLISKCSQEEAARAFRDWVFEKTFVRITSYETLSVGECKTIVSFLHRHRGAFKNTHSIGA